VISARLPSMATSMVHGRRAAERAAQGGILEPACVHARDPPQCIYAVLFDECGERRRLLAGAVGPRRRDLAQPVRSAGRMHQYGRCSPTTPAQFRSIADPVAAVQCFLIESGALRRLRADVSDIAADTPGGMFRSGCSGWVRLNPERGSAGTAGPPVGQAPPIAGCTLNFCPAAGLAGRAMRSPAREKRLASARDR
jgi:hypothetical protein